jgi:hypothetical protein
MEDCGIYYSHEEAGRHLWNMSETTRMGKPHRIYLILRAMSSNPVASKELENDTLYFIR